MGAPLWTLAVMPSGATMVLDSVSHRCLDRYSAEMPQLPGPAGARVYRACVPVVCLPGCVLACVLAMVWSAPLLREEIKRKFSQ